MRAAWTQPAGAAYRLAVVALLCLPALTLAHPSAPTVARADAELAALSMPAGPAAVPPAPPPRPYAPAVEAARAYTDAAASASGPSGARPAPTTDGDVTIPSTSADVSPPAVPIVFVSRNRMPSLDGHYVGPGVNIIGRELTPGGRLLVWRPDGTIRDLTAGARIYDVMQPDVSFDGRKVVFAGVDANKAQWHLYEVGIDGSGLRQLTGKPRGFAIPPDPTSPGRNESVFGRWGDYAPAYLPDGRIVFESTRYATLSASCGQRGLNLYVLDPATGAITRRTTVRSGAIDPAVMSNGMVVYSNWVDLMVVPSPDGPGMRPLEADYSFAPSFWGIWAINPDGSNNGRIVFPAGGLQDYGGLHQPRELPNGDIVATARASGGLLGDTLASAITVVRPGLVPPRGMKFIGDPYLLEAAHAMGPAPLPDGRIAFAYTITPTVGLDWQGETHAEYDFGLYVLDDSRQRMASLYDDPETDELDPVAVHPRQAQVIPDLPHIDRISDDPTVDFGLTARLINRNVYADMPLELLELPSPKAGTVARVDVYDDSQVFTVDPDFPHISKQNPRFLGSFPVDPSGAFTATVPTDRALAYVLVNHAGVAARSSLSPTSPGRDAGSVVHFFGHDYLRPGGDFVCTGCHRGHMISPAPALASRPNLARLATALASSTRSEFENGAWRVNDVRLADTSGRWAWSTTEGAGSWVRLDWAAPIVAERVLVYPLRAAGGRVTAATLTLGDGTRLELPSPPVDGGPLVVPLVPPRPVSWLRLTVDDVAGRVAGVAEIVVEGPGDVRMPDVPPPAPENLRATQGAIALAWDRLADGQVAGYRLHYGTAAGVYTSTVDVGDVSTYIFRDRAVDGATYHFVARSYNLRGTESVTASNEVTATAHAPLILSVEPDHGRVAGGTTVTIHGRHFAAQGARVSIGPHATSVRVVDEETITAVTRRYYPAVVDVRVTNFDDQSGVLEKGYTYVVPERPMPAVYLPLLARRAR